jgi:hypothetical protein
MVSVILLSADPVTLLLPRFSVGVKAEPVSVQFYLTATLDPLHYLVRAVRDRNVSTSARRYTQRLVGVSPVAEFDSKVPRQEYDDPRRARKTRQGPSSSRMHNR